MFIKYSLLMMLAAVSFSANIFADNNSPKPREEASFMCRFHEPKFIGQDRCVATGTFDAEKPDGDHSRGGDQGNHMTIKCDGFMVYNDGLSIEVGHDRDSETLFIGHDGNPQIRVDDLDWNHMRGAFVAALRISLPGERNAVLDGVCEFKKDPRPSGTPAL